MRVVVVGAGIAGVACARELAAAGATVTVLDRGRRIGGRMASRRIGDRPVDLGASYFTVDDADFAGVADDWRRRGLARPWTTRFAVLDGGAVREAEGPVRWAAPTALRSLVEDLAAGLDVQTAVVERVVRTDAGFTVEGEVTLAADAVVLAMPDPQARPLLGQDEPALTVLTRDWEPVLALVADWDDLAWDADGAFVNEDPVLSFVAHDGRRRGDGAPVLVAHSTPAFAQEHLADPAAAGPELAAALCARLALPTPRQILVKRWSLARPVGTRPATHALVGGLGLCGDGWGEPSRIQTAWVSGRALARELAS